MDGALEAAGGAAEDRDGVAAAGVAEQGVDGEPGGQADGSGGGDGHRASLRTPRGAAHPEAGQEATTDHPIPTPRETSVTTPSSPDNDTLDDGTHAGEPEEQASGRTPDITDNDNDVPDGGDASRG